MAYTSPNFAALRRRGRWTSERTLEGHIQESTCFLHSLTLAPVTRDRIEALADLAPAVCREASPTAPTSTDSRQVTLAHPGREISLPPLRRGKNRKSFRSVVHFSIHWNHRVTMLPPTCSEHPEFGVLFLGFCLRLPWIPLAASDLESFLMRGSCVSSISCIYSFMDARHYTQTRV